MTGDDDAPDDLPEPWHESLAVYSWTQSQQYEHLAPGYLAHAFVHPVGIYRSWCWYRTASDVFAIHWDSHSRAAIGTLFRQDPDELMRLWSGEISNARTGEVTARGWIVPAAVDSLRVACFHAGPLFPPLGDGYWITKGGIIRGPGSPWGMPTSWRMVG